jgi:hypothetical protein
MPAEHVSSGGGILPPSACAPLDAFRALITLLRLGDGTPPRRCASYGFFVDGLLVAGPFVAGFSAVVVFAVALS